VESACIHDSQGRVFASYGVCPVGSAGWFLPDRPGHRIIGGHMEVYAPITEAGEAIGVISLTASLDDVRAGFLRTVKLVGAAVLVAIALSILLGSRLSRSISQPLLHLADAAREVSEGGDYSIRVRKENDDEIGVLCDGFNEMLGQIQRRDTALEFLAAIEQAAEMIFITDPDSTIRYLNPAFEKATGYSREEVLGKMPYIFANGTQDAALIRELEKTVSRGDVWSGHIVNRRKDGTLFTAEATVSPVRDQSGAIVKYVTTQRDVTKEMEADERLRQAQKLEAVGQLAGGIAHDLNNVLTVINGHAELLLKRADGGSPELASSATQILAGGQRAAALVKQVLAFSRKQLLRPQILSPNAVVSEIEAMLRTLLSERIDLVLALDPAAGLVEADLTQVEQVIMNLAVNARDSMPDGGRLTISTANARRGRDHAGSLHDLEAGEYVMLAVSDSGVGMSPEVLNRVFEPFFTTKELGKGTGLGLSTVYGIVKQSGGEVEVESSPGIGTTFRVYLPVAKGSPEASVSGRSPDEATKQAGTETVLLVEDEVTVRDFLSSVLRDIGYTVLEVGNGNEALAAARAHHGPIHVALTDVMMPGMSGPELAQKLTAVRPDTQILFMSGYPDAMLGGGGLPPGTSFLAKPIRRDALATMMRETLGARRGGDEHRV
jgi:two-component system cell cycle sensor histidine kinase/response regulator CckA